jgi:hypothetical protein
MRIRSTLVPLLLASSLLGLLGGCASPPQARAVFDQSTDFPAYKTFGFVSPLGTDRGGYQSVVSQYLKTATQRQLEARGMRLDPAAPQLLVNFNAVLNNELRVTTQPAMGMGPGFYGYRRGFYGAWPGYVEQTVSQEKVGTLNIDLIDASRKQLVWEGVVTDSITQKTLDNVQASIDSAVAAAFAKYPVPAREGK